MLSVQIHNTIKVLDGYAINLTPIDHHLLLQISSLMCDWEEAARMLEAGTLRVPGQDLPDNVILLSRHRSLVPDKCHLRVAPLQEEAARDKPDFKPDPDAA